MNPCGLLVITFSSESLETIVLHTDIKLVTICCPHFGNAEYWFLVEAYLALLGYANPSFEPSPDGHEVKVVTDFYLEFRTPEVNETATTCVEPRASQH